MKYITIIGILLCASHHLFAQQEESNQLLFNFDKDEFRFSDITQKEINENWSYFGSSTFTTRYDSVGAFEIDITHLASRKIYKNIGAVGGISFEEKDLFANVGMAYSKESNNFDISIYPTLTYAFKAKAWGMGLNAIAEYNPVLKGNTRFFSLLLVDFDYSFKGEVASSQYLGIGIEPKKNLQIGLGLDFSQEDKFKDNSFAPGIFLGVSF